jgi:hypothetical protein
VLNAVLDNRGLLHVEQAVTIDRASAQARAHALRVDGATFTNHGRLRPGGGAVWRLTIQGSALMGSTSAIEVDRTKARTANSTASGDVVRPSDRRMEASPSRMRPMATSTWDGLTARVWQAEAPETATPARSRPMRRPSWASAIRRRLATGAVRRGTYV